MPTLGALNGVHGEGANSVYTETIEFRPRSGCRRSGSCSFGWLHCQGDSSVGIWELMKKPVTR